MFRWPITTKTCLVLSMGTREDNNKDVSRPVNGDSRGQQKDVSRPVDGDSGGQQQRRVSSCRRGLGRTTTKTCLVLSTGTREDNNKDVSRPVNGDSGGQQQRRVSSCQGEDNNTYSFETRCVFLNARSHIWRHVMCLPKRTIRLLAEVGLVE